MSPSSQRGCPYSGQVDISLNTPTALKVLLSWEILTCQNIIDQLTRVWALCLAFPRVVACATLHCWISCLAFSFGSMPGRGKSIISKLHSEWPLLNKFFGSEDAGLFPNLSLSLIVVAEMGLPKLKNHALIRKWNKQSIYFK